ncbi:hypothetical protein TNCT_655781 [Trichonephila clavata]|uniref:Uncharacterized protein n=1 Tax=Trichonephila clavata TaxID=2740835 RepID=A0A8X6KER6_TRICU|nr:hypothetical protein TNCT_655781 [Trichonephila clavata]
MKETKVAEIIFPCRRVEIEVRNRNLDRETAKRFMCGNCAPGTGVNPLCCQNIIVNSDFFGSTDEEDTDSDYIDDDSDSDDDYSDSDSDKYKETRI